MVRKRAWTGWYLVRYWRLLKLRITQPGVIVEGLVFLDKGAELTARPGYGRLIIGSWTHIGAGAAIRAHEGTLRIGEKCVIGRQSTINSYLDVELGAASLVADWVYISDFDHKAVDLHLPIKDQGIVKTPVRIGPNCWLGVKATITRGVRIGEGSIVGANAVVTRDVAAFSVVGGAPARLLRRRVLEPPAHGAAAREAAVHEPASDGESGAVAGIVHDPDYQPVISLPSGPETLPLITPPAITPSSAQPSDRVRST